MALLFAQPVSAGEAILPISVTLVQCERAIPLACKKDSRCCVFLDSYELAHNGEANQNNEIPFKKAFLENLSYKVDISETARTQLLP